MDFIKFLGTAGARIVVSRQLRASGGTWISLAGVNVFLDPGPGALVKCLSSRPKLDPGKLDAVILSHRHLDHSNDANILVEAMSDGGFKPRGALFAPVDAIEGPEPVVFSYARGFVREVHVLREGFSHRLGDVELSCPVRHHHAVETYGLVFRARGLTVSFITDTDYFPELAGHYSGSDVLVINTVRLKSEDSAHISHMALDEAEELICAIRPRKAVLTHFGMTMVRAKEWEAAAAASDRLGIEVIAARDGMTVELGAAAVSADD